MLTLTRDGNHVAYLANGFDLMRVIHKSHPYSVEHALTYEGYSVTGTDCPRTTDMPANRTALRCLTSHDCDPTWTRDEKADNCGACALSGMGHHRDGDSGAWEPNYASWERTYVEAHKGIPTRYRDAFLHALNEDTPYGSALRDACDRYGVHYVD